MKDLQHIAFVPHLYDEHDYIQTHRIFLPEIFQDVIAWAKRYAIYDVSIYPTPSDYNAIVMPSFFSFFYEYRDILKAEGVCIVVYGVDEHTTLYETVKPLVDETAQQEHVRVHIFVNHHARDDILSAANAMIQDYHCGRLTEEGINEEWLKTYLVSGDLIGPDLIIQAKPCLSDVLLWDMSYSEFYIAKTPLVSLTASDLDDIMANYGQRIRRYGNV